MNLKPLSKDEYEVCFNLSGIDASFANALRRTMLAEVPTMAIDVVEFKKNSSVLYDEIIAHRLGLVPFSTDLKSYELPELCSCKGEGCAKCQLKMTLSAKGPCIVTAGEIQSKDPKVKPVHPKTIIVKLLKGQELEFEATGMLGTGQKHMKWSPGHIFFKNEAVIKLNKDSFEGADKIPEVCPQDIFEMKGNKLAIKKDNVLNCHLCEACTSATKEISVTSVEDSFIFYIESWGQLDTKEIFKQACDILTAKCDEFAGKVKEIKH